MSRSSSHAVVFLAALGVTVLGAAVLGSPPVRAALPLEMSERFEIAGKGTLTIEGLGELPGSFSLVLVVHPDGEVVVPRLRARIRDFDVVQRRVFKDRRTPFRCSEALNVGPLEGRLDPTGELFFAAPQEVYAVSYSERDGRGGCPGRGGAYSLTAVSNVPVVGLHSPWDDVFSLAGSFVTDHDGETYTVHLAFEGSYVNRPPLARMSFEGVGLPTGSHKYTCPPYVPLTFAIGRASFSCNFVQANDPGGLRARLVSTSADPDGAWHRSELKLEQWSNFVWSFDEGTETHVHLGRGRTVGPVLFEMNQRHTVQLTASDHAGAADRATCEFCVVDGMPPVVTAPPSTTVRCSVEGGATPGTSRALRDFLDAAVAVDQADDAPERLTPRVGGADVEDHTLFPLDEWTEVVFRFQDRAENVAVAHGAVRVIDDVPPELTFDFAAPRLPAQGRFVKVRPQIQVTDNCGLPRVLFRSIASNGPESTNLLVRGAVRGRPVKEFEILATPVTVGGRVKDRTYVVTYVAVDAAGNKTEIYRKLVVKARP
jgi:hypothetical protein